jgi:hypothetical protein
MNTKFLTGAIGLAGMLMISGCYEQKMREQYKAEGCVPTTRIELRDQPKVYCGKACFRYKVREEFACGPQHKEIRSFEY